MRRTSIKRCPTCRQQLPSGAKLPAASGPPPCRALGALSEYHYVITVAKRRASLFDAVLRRSRFALSYAEQLAVAFNGTLVRDGDLWRVVQPLERGA